MVANIPCSRCVNAIPNLILQTLRIEPDIELEPPSSREMVTTFTETFSVRIADQEVHLPHHAALFSKKQAAPVREQTRVSQRECKECHNRQPLDDCLQRQLQRRFEAPVQGVRCVASGELDTRVVNM